MNKFLMLLTIFSLGSCHTINDIEVHTPYVDAFTGAIFTLNEPIEISPFNAGTYIQAGKIVSFSQVNHYFPFCRIEVRAVMESSQVIHMDKFIVRNVVRDQELRSSSDLMAANTGIFGISDGLSAEIFSTTFYLQSDSQPSVHDLVCGNWEEPLDSEYLSLDQVQQTLGTIMAIHIPENRLSNMNLN